MRRAFCLTQSLLLVATVASFDYSRNLLHIAFAKNAASMSWGQSSLSCVDYTKNVPSFGYEHLFSDLVWLEFIQYLGSHASEQKEFSSQVSRYLDCLISLDPEFVEPYYFAAIVLGGDCHRPDLAAELINSGMGNVPGDWRLPYIAGVNQFLYAHDARSAAKFYLRASTFPGAPYWLKGQSQILAANIPQIIKEINVWDNLLAQTADVHVRQIAKSNLIALWTKVYNGAPSDVIRRRAVQQLKKLGNPMDF